MAETMARRVPAGTLRHTVTIKQPTAGTPDSYGQATETYAAFPTGTSGKHRVNIRPMRGRELTEAQQIHADVTHKVVMRYVADITSDMQLVFGTRTFEILAPPLDRSEIGHTAELMARERI